MPNKYTETFKSVLLGNEFEVLFVLQHVYCVFFKDPLDWTDCLAWRGNLETLEHPQPQQPWEALSSPGTVRPQRSLPAQKGHSLSIAGSLFFLYKEMNKPTDKTWVTSKSLFFSHVLLYTGHQYSQPGVLLSEAQCKHPWVPYGAFWREWIRTQAWCLIFILECKALEGAFLTIVDLAQPVECKQFLLRWPVCFLILKVASFLKLCQVISYYMCMKNREYFEAKTFINRPLPVSKC